MCRLKSTTSTPSKGGALEKHPHLDVGRRGHRGRRDPRHRFEPEDRLRARDRGGLARGPRAEARRRASAHPALIEVLALRREHQGHPHPGGLSTFPCRKVGISEKLRYHSALDAHKHRG